MPASSEDRLRVAAVINALKTAGVRVKNWKNFLNGASTQEDSCKQESRCNWFAFGRDLTLLPQCRMPEMGGAVPQFLVDACEFLSLHLHTEGLFRKTGSLSRIRTLRIELEQGEPVFSPPLSSALQPCDVASLLKQFLRELPSPLIPLELQGALCRAQGLGAEGGWVGGRDGVTLLVTALFPPSHARALRYFCAFLRRAAQRCSENRMEIGSLALVIAPNLLHCPAGGCKLTVGTERLLDRQASVIKALITHADRIGVVPSVVMEAVSSPATSGGTAPSEEGVGFQERAGLNVYRSLRRQRRRSVGEMFVDAFSKLKTGGRTPTGPSRPTDSPLGQQVAVSPTPQSPITTKRKASEDTLPEMEGSAKKRRSVHDLREDNQPVSHSCSDESESTLSRSPTPSLSSVLSGVEGGEEQKPPPPSTASGKKRNQRRDTRRVQRIPGQEERAQRRRRSLRFFTMTGWSGPSNTAPSPGSEAGSGSLGAKGMMDNPDKPSSAEGSGHFRAPVILINGPGGVVVGNEVEDDPDLLNCSFVENPQDFLPLDAVGVGSGAWPEEMDGRAEGKNGAGDWRATGRGPEAGIVGTEGEWAEPGVSVTSRDGGTQPAGVEREERACPGEEWRDVDVCRRVSQGHRPPRRSISLPEVTSEQVGSPEEEEEEEEEEEVGEGRECSNAHQRPGFVQDDTEGRPQRGTEGKEKCVRETEEEREGEEAKEERSEKGEEKRRLAREKEEEKESTPAFTRSNQRMSVAERMWRFNSLSAWLRPPRPPPRPPPLPPPLPPAAPKTAERAGAPKGAVRLRRQGARRFSRSISHEGVAGLLQGPNAPAPQPRRRKLWDSPPNQPRHPPRQQPHGQQQQSVEGSQPPRCPREPGRPRNQAELQEENPSRKQGYPSQEPENLLQEPDLHELLELQLRIRNPEPWLEKEPPAPPPSQPDISQNSLRLTVPPSQQDLPAKVRSPRLLSPPVPLHHHADTCSHRAPGASSQLSVELRQPSPPGSQPYCPLQVSTHTNSPPENGMGVYYMLPSSADGLTERGNGGDGGCLSYSPLALQFRATRRRYRDSPRWPIPEIRITTLTPFQL
ncbi:hypothetical protein MATL_G00042750 [Megalops atlanticus]|uniref:Rho-GAP domain-containing protein n=1 Tax=Megalops atlanticus TaxID=7932 RepID=A0A9D3QEM8_MEGAT|nr:hypothetical protein MATL_G00042750 [Megalops atlanticus]